MSITSQYNVIKIIQIISAIINLFSRRYIQTITKNMHSETRKMVLIMFFDYLFFMLLVGSSEDVKSADLNKLNMSRRSKPVAKAMSPNRQGPQQCLVSTEYYKIQHK